MTTPNNGGPAFPRIDGLEKDSEWRTSVYCTDGMTLRDYFAAKAMQGMVGSQKVQEGLGTFHSIAEAAYVQADAMLAARGAP